MQRHREWGPWCEYCLHFQGRIRPRRPRELTGKRKTEQILRRKGDLHAAYLNAGEKVYRQGNIDARHCSFSKGAKSFSTGCKGHFYQTLECANGKRMLFILDTGSVKSIIASADLRKFCPETVLQPTLAIILGVIGVIIVSSWPDRNCNWVIRRMRCTNSVSDLAKGHNTSWAKSNEATVSKHHAPRDLHQMV